MRDPEAAQLLTDPRQVEVLKPFLQREISVPEAARELKVKANSLLYQVRKMERLNLITFTRMRGRQKLYQSTADAYFVPFDLSTADTFQGFLDAQYLAKLDRFTYSYSQSMLRLMGVPVGIGIKRDPVNGVAYSFLSKDGESSLSPEILAPEGPAILTLWTRLFLDPEDAKELQQDLAGLYARYKQRQGKTPYLIHLDLTPERS
ncbi:hypothetical protein DC3_04980 [Deinococcus cellulosilyticus NBRC 106333 = KACC 11606]|uniref:Uncharacterized protein n=1 Tax=Deinococcus cellulosilyticus (strain DSM 18568 / NBRC 106333 / KACC 11606 / 5516J-15) TaxID=1223518 RepID=A0A511MWA4_DEIC1|nr:hypothetical protein DC3_04980 [Deinococcus cellulosilyticus NBRC 106333 = KACC 11606]